jgi:hypothetical protein
MDTVACDLLGIMVKFMKGDVLMKFKRLGIDQHITVTKYMESKEYLYNLFIFHYKHLKYIGKTIPTRIEETMGDGTLDRVSYERLVGYFWIMSEVSYSAPGLLMLHELGQIESRFKYFKVEKFEETQNSNIFRYKHKDGKIRYIHHFINQCPKYDIKLLTDTVCELLERFEEEKELVMFILMAAAGRYSYQIERLIYSSHATNCGKSRIMLTIEDLHKGDFWFLRKHYYDAKQ